MICQFGGGSKKPGWLDIRLSECVGGDGRSKKFGDWSFSPRGVKSRWLVIPAARYRSWCAGKVDSSGRTGRERVHGRINEIIPADENLVELVRVCVKICVCMLERMLDRWFVSNRTEREKLHRHEPPPPAPGLMSLDQFSLKANCHKIFSWIQFVGLGF